MPVKLPQAPELLGGTFQDDLADRTTSAVVDPQMLEDVAARAKQEAEFRRFQDGLIASQAESAGYPEGDWELIVQNNPDLARTLLDRAADREKVQGQRRAPDQIDMGVASKKASGKSDQEVERLAKSLLPARKKNSHVVMVDPPDADGHRYGYSEIPKDRRSVERAIERGFTLDFRKLEFIECLYPCPLPLATGTKCTYWAPNPEALLQHERIHHPQTFEMRRQAKEQAEAEARRAREEARDEQLQAAIAKIAEGGSGTADLGAAVAMMAELLAEMKKGK